MIEIGIKGHQETTVTAADVASSVGSGTLQVFATPIMVALMEKAAFLSIEPFLERGQSSVGTRINIEHVRSTAMGKKVWAESEIIAVDRRKLSFKVAAYDEKGLIGQGEHERFIIDIEKFLSKVESKD
ncbi:MAG: thioesterase family protein [Bacteroidales bacterium]|nr:thioesterase family protein [Candidatus Egerieousia equi]